MLHTYGLSQNPKPGGELGPRGWGGPLLAAKILVHNLKETHGDTTYARPHII
jgi:hypothetical protein